MKLSSKFSVYGKPLIIPQDSVSLGCSRQSWDFYLGAFFITKTCNMDFPPFYAGQQVVVLRTVTRSGTTYLTKNETRVIKDIRKNQCGTFPWIVDVGVEGSGFWRCPACTDSKKIGGSIVWFESDLFMGLDSLKTVTFEKIEEAIPVGAN